MKDCSALEHYAFPVRVCTYDYSGERGGEGMM